jgi:hypothetical protein
MFDIQENTFGDNKCFICNKEFKHSRAWIKRKDAELPELILKVSHRNCEKLIKQIKNTRDKLEELEFDLFCMTCPY